MLTTSRKWWHPQTSGLRSLNIGSLVLTPEFASSVKEYSAETANATNKVTAELLDSKDSMTIKVNGTEIQNKGTATWVEGENTVTVDVHDTYSGQDITYEVTVTYTPPEVEE